MVLPVGFPAIGTVYSTTGFFLSVGQDSRMDRRCSALSPPPSVRTAAEIQARSELVVIMLGRSRLLRTDKLAGWRCRQSICIAVDTLSASDLLTPASEPTHRMATSSLVGSRLK